MTDTVWTLEVKRGRVRGRRVLEMEVSRREGREAEEEVGGRSKEAFAGGWIRGERRWRPGQTKS